MRHSAGWAVSAMLVVAATAANAQGPGRGQYQAVSDFESPYAGGPPPAPPPAVREPPPRSPGPRPSISKNADGSSVAVPSTRNRRRKEVVS